MGNHHKFLEAKRHMVCLCVLKQRHGTIWQLAQPTTVLMHNQPGMGLFESTIIYDKDIAPQKKNIENRPW